VDAGLDRIAVVLTDSALAELPERVAVGLRPPLPRLPRRVEVGAQGVDRVGEVVGDPGADRAVVHGVRCHEVERPRLQEAGWQRHQVELDVDVRGG
jgi:hypothetical protein